MASTATMLDSAAYKRMRAENPSEFEPKRVLLAHVDRESEIDRGNSFWVKAALVYDSLTGAHVNDRTMQLSRDLLLHLANTCCSRISAPTSPSPPTPTPTPSPSPPTPAPLLPPPSQGDATKRMQHPDEGTKDNQLVIDAIFLVVGFLPRLTKPAGGKGGSGGKGGGAPPSRDTVDDSFKETHMQYIVTDVVKLENQLPIKHLLDVVDHVEKAVHEAADIKEFKDIAAALKRYELGFERESFDDVIRSFCWYYSPFFSKQAAAPAKDEQAKKADSTVAAADERTLLDCLHASVVPHTPSSEEAAAAAGGGVEGGKTSRIPTAKELRRSGVLLKAVEEGRAVVQFKEDSATLRLPALVYDFKLATVARNLLARELEEQSKPVTRYFQLMNELVEEVADVKILRRAGVVRGGSRGASEVHELIKKVDGYATYPSVFMAMDVQVEKVTVFHKKRMDNFFVRNRPTVIWASSVVAASVVAIVAARAKRG
ncbi:hypothetical protein E2562_003517 [Oryza meyeriana var. granulata]|uniref:Uncharacterized protein n=1 Tax=Oryza meyeriana var. granulata TaxID=110450 RepID=A0A6G1CM55_9ORYZ|nr:hypothetical protein E2562_003517 [Oryza meyeriana var. granulata]